MGKASRTKQDPDRRARIAAQRAAERRQARRNRLLLAGGAIVVVVAVVLVFVFAVGGKKPTASSTSGLTGAQLTSVTNQITSVPASVLNKVGDGGSAVNSGSSPIITLKGGSPLTENGKPEMLFMGAEYCPYCAAERWAMIVALSRFGTFTGLQTTHSSSTDVNPNTPTWTFVNAKYTSSDLAFTSVEMEGNVANSSGDYPTLQTPTSAEEALINKWDTAPYIPSSDAGSIPFVDIDNKYMISGASYNGQVLDGKTYQEIATAMKDPSSSIAQGVDGTANYITAALCKVTNNQSTSACTPVVKGLESKL
jgi:thiol-disulfide isomerase/thioredoxin